MKNSFISFQKLFSFLVYLYIFGRIFLEKRATVSFESHNVTNWTTNNYNIHITQYIKK